MKKVLFILVASLALVGCEKANNYKEGTYEANVIDNYNNESNTASAKITIDSNGKITEVYLDTTYVKNGVETTKKALKEDYGMKAYGSADYEWYEQVEALEQAIIEHQNLDFLNLDEDGYTDTVSKCTIKINALVKAVEEALNKAK